MKEIVNEPGNLILTEYCGIIDEIELNWGFKRGYFEEENIPVLFIYSNFPHYINTNKQSLVGSIRTHVEEKKGIIFFPDGIKEEVKKFVHEALKKEKVDLDFHPYSGEIYNQAYLASICETCFSIKNIKLKEVIKMETPKSVQNKTIQQKDSIHKKMFEALVKSENKDFICFVMEKESKTIDLVHLAANRRDSNYIAHVKDKAFKTQFFDLFFGEHSTHIRIKDFYEEKDWIFHSLLIFYSKGKKRVFIHDLPETAFFLNTDEDTFFSLNTEYSLMSYNFEEKPQQTIRISKNKISQRFDISIDNNPQTEQSLIHAINTTFPGCSKSVNQILHMFTNSQLTEFCFYYDKMAVFVKIEGSDYMIENHEAKIMNQ